MGPSPLAPSRIFVSGRAAWGVKAETTVSPRDTEDAILISLPFLQLRRFFWSTDLLAKFPKRVWTKSSFSNACGRCAPCPFRRRSGIRACASFASHHRPPVRTGVHRHVAEPPEGPSAELQSGLPPTMSTQWPFRPALQPANAKRWPYI